ncbi:MAG: HU family DNA-binding protein [Succinivibrio sp.]|nr:HU family DNA-binding protein [Succinivibrio sp.]
MVNKSELVESVAKKSGLSNKNAASAVSAVLEAIKDALANGDQVTLVGFGTFLVRERAARQGVNPRTKQKVEIPAVKAPAFKAGKPLKDAVNG